MMVWIKKLEVKVKEVLEILNRNEMRILPGQLAFYLLMSLIPIIVLVTLIASRITESVDFISLVSHGIPEGIVEMLKTVVSEAENYDNFASLAICYIFLAMNGSTSIIYISNSLYGLKEENFIKTKIKAFLMIIIIVLLFLFLLVIPVLGDFIVKILSVILFLPNFLVDNLHISNVFVIILTFIVLFIGINIIYALAPAKKNSIKSTYKGAIFTSVFWIVATEIFSFYVKNIAKYDELYGNFANILVLLLWVYLLAYVFVLGMVLNKSKFSNYNKLV